MAQTHVSTPQEVTQEALSSPRLPVKRTTRARKQRDPGLGEKPEPGQTTPAKRAAKKTTTQKTEAVQVSKRSKQSESAKPPTIPERPIPSKLVEEHHNTGVPFSVAIRAHPYSAPEILALNAVQRLGPHARDRLAWLRSRYPGIRAEEIASIACQRLIRQARYSGALTALSGPMGTTLGIGAQGYLRVTLILDVAAAFGLDPTNRRRAGEILFLHNFYDDLETAEAALDLSSNKPGLSIDHRTEQLCRFLALGIARWSVYQYVSRLSPAITAAMGAFIDERLIRQLYEKAKNLYSERAKIHEEQKLGATFNSQKLQ